MSIKTYNTREAARFLDVKPNTVLQALNRGRLQALGSAPYEFAEDELRRYDEERKRTPRHGQALANRRFHRKLDPDEVDEIIHRYREGNIKQADLAQEFGVSQSRVSAIIANAQEAGIL